MANPAANRRTATRREADRLRPIRPIVGDRFSLEHAAEALLAIDDRRASGKVVLDVRS